MEETFGAPNYQQDHALKSLGEDHVNRQASLGAEGNTAAIEFHPYSEIFPLLSEDLQQLSKDIAEHGVQNPIVLHDGKILDGRRRRLAAEQAGVTPSYVIYTGSDPLA
jgi:ParB-like nuclease domain